MTRRGAAVLGLLLGVLLVGCSGGTRPRADPPPSPSVTVTGEPSPSASDGHTRPCRGVSYDGVRGRAPAYGPQRLRDYPAAGAVCAAYWLPAADRGFVAQSVAIDGRRGFVGGYRWARSVADEPCQIAVLDLRTGRQVAFQPKFQASVYRPAPTYCRHDGGMALGVDGLWVQETERLWLLDPDKIGHGDPVRRVWRLQKGRIRGSTFVAQGGRIGVAGFRTSGQGHLTWFRTQDVLRPGVDDLRVRGGDATDARSVASGSVPLATQGIAATGSGLWFATSGVGCASLIDPPGRPHTFVPGAEGVAFVGDRLWVVSESGAASVLRRNHATTTVPVLLALDRSRVERGRAPVC